MDLFTEYQVVVLPYKKTFTEENLDLPRSP
jgi:hypothetical protein